MSKGRRTFSLNYLFASFFGALMIAGAFAYYNYKFSQYKFIDFEKLVFYKKADLFYPKKENYVVLVYSSRQTDFKDIFSKIKHDYPIIAIDIHQSKRDGKEQGVEFVSSGINTLLKFVQRFNIYEVPTAFYIKKQNKNQYKQNSPIQTIR